MEWVDCIYVAASAHDARYTRTCIASIRYFYPQVPIRLLVGGRLQRGLAEELHRYWEVGIADVPGGDYGWGFVKLEALFGRPGERFLVLDSDTVLAGPVLHNWTDIAALFVVDDEKHPEAEAKELYYDWQKLRKVDSEARAPEFLFNTGQWFGTAGALSRCDFEPWLKWTMPRKVCPPGYFMNGEQGLLNYVLNRKVAFDGLAVERRKLMCWPGRSMDGVSARSVSKHAAPAVIVHWAGMKKARQRDLLGADLLKFFENMYYGSLPAGKVRRLMAACGHCFTSWLASIQLRVKLRFRIWAAYLAKRVSRRNLGGLQSFGGK